MIINYQIKIENNEEVLYVTLNDFHTEFAKLGAESEENKNLLHQIEDFMASKQISFKGNVVKVLAGSLVVATLLLHPGMSQVAKAASTNTSSYVVQSGDSLYKIANLFGLTVTELKTNNQLTTDTIYPGETLIVGNPTITTNLYTVVAGDTLSKLASRANTTIGDLKTINLLSSDTIRIGQVLLVNPKSQVGTYTVKSGDTLWSIAQKYAMSWTDIQTLNGNPLAIYPGQTISVLEQRAATTYKVQSGDTLWGIANRNGISVATLKSLNGLTTDVIQPGQVLTVNGTVTSTPSPTPAPTPTTTQKYIQVDYKGTVQSVPLEQYITGVVASEMGPNFSPEAYKAQALAARTYAMKRVSEGKVLGSTDAAQVYTSVADLKSQWGSHYDAYYTPIYNAVMATQGQVIEYNGTYIDAVFFSTSNGKTEDPSYIWGSSVPYLKSVDSHWDTTSPFFFNETKMSYSQFASEVGIPNSNLYATVLTRTANGSVDTINIAGRVFSGSYIYRNLGLHSTDFDISFSNGTVTIDQRGWGHMVGLSQYGAQAMALDGYSYSQIIHHYYTGVDIVSL